MLVLTPDDKRRAMNRGLLAAGTALMGAGAPTTNPNGFGAGLANAGAMFGQAYDNAIQSARQTALGNIQVQMAQDNQKFQQDNAAATQAYRNSVLAQNAQQFKTGQANAKVIAALKAKQNPFGGSTEGKMLEIYNSGPSHPSYGLATQYLSRPKTINTPQGVMTIPAVIPAQPSGPTGAPTPISAQPGGLSQTAEQALDLTPAQKVVDAEFAKSYQELVASGGMADVEKGLAQLEGVIASLKKPDGPNLTGSFVGNLPDGIKAITHPEAMNSQDLVEEVVQRNLRVILGAQFTEEEGKRLIARAYNPRLDEAQNAERLQRLYDSMAKAARAKMQAVKYYELYGTLKGYDGGRLFSLSDIEKASKLDVPHTSRDENTSESTQSGGSVPASGASREQWLKWANENGVPEDFVK